ncbi:MAG: hypothetical protein JSV95_13625 [Gemmatimonadota bacterium]|nr:MAG: hypothetical protein JSV95_13625 [Gemmatimonadota bacterium]
MSRSLLFAAGAWLASLGLPTTSAAQEAAAVCALGALRECGPDLQCLPASPWQDPEPPGFVRVDVESETITILSPPSRRGETTRIRGMERTGDNIILTGIEAGRGWSMVIAISDGEMTLSATDDGTAFIGRGKCIDAGLVEP